MLKKLLLISLLVAVPIMSMSCSEDDPDDVVSLKALSDNHIRIASYNLLFQKSLPTEKSQRWTNRIVQVNHIFNDCKLDVIGSQEALTFQVNMLLRSGKFARLGTDLSGQSDEPMNENEALFYRVSRLDVLDSGQFWFSETPDVVGSYSWGATYCRACTWGKFQEKTSGVIFYVFNSHFHVDVEKAELKEAELLLAKVKEIAGDYPAICTGDLNSLPDSETVLSLLSDGTLSDSHDIAVESSGPEGTYSGFSSEIPTARLDYVLVKKGISVDWYRVVDEELTTKRYGSDHLPVVVDVNIP